jgi:NAD(P)-dependent dehydrogenase (short-subunit alcohol dehydrogenase family)
MDLQLKNQKALVTGASSGIGRATAIALAKEGCKLIISSRNEVKLKYVQEECQSFLSKKDIIPLMLDLNDPVSIKFFLKKMKTMNPSIDLFLNIAGYIETSLLKNMDEENWQKTLNVNVTGPFILFKHLHQYLAKNARIVNVSSMAGVLGAEKFIGFGAYTSAKMAITGLTEVMAVELKERGIRANVLCPGAVDTPMLKKAAPDLKPAMQPEDMANHILFYGSKCSHPINGQTIIIDNLKQ